MAEGRPADIPRVGTTVLAGSVCVVAILAIAGWLLGVASLTRAASRYVPISPSAAVAFLALGLSVLAVELWGKRRPGTLVVGACLTAVVVLLCHVLLQAVSGIDMGLEAALCRAVGAPAVYPLARMSPIAAFLLLVTAMATALASPWGGRWRHSNDASAGLATLTLAGGLIITLGYVLGSPPLYGGSIRPVALPTGAAFILVSLALLALLRQKLWGAGSRLPAYLALSIGVVVSFGVYAMVEASERATELPHVPWHGRAVLLAGLILTALQAAYLNSLARYHARIDAASGALRRAEARHRAVVETATDAIITIDARGAIVHWNDAAARTFGRTAEEVSGRPITLLIPERFQGAHLAGMGRVAEGGQARLAGRTLELVGVSKDGREFPIELSMARWIVGGGTYFTAIIRDLTERKRLETHLAHAQKLEAVAKLSAGVAHNLNNLLQGMMGTAGMLRGHAVEPAAVRDDASAIEGQVRRAAALSRQLTLFARQEVEQREPLDLGALVSALAPRLGGLLPGNVRLTITPAAEPLAVEADSAQLEQVLVNLVENACEAMPKGGSLAVRTRSGDGRKALLEVVDSGGGIATEHLLRIFDPFFSTKGADKGGGLGLAVVHGIVKGHGGEVAVESTVGSGSTFRVELPLVAEGQIKSGDGVRRAAGAARGERILLVDDDDTVRRSLSAALELLGYVPTVASSGEEAERLAAVQRFDLLLTDLVLPGLSGGELARRLGDRSPGLTVILMSGFTEDEVIKRTISQGTMRFLQKPFDIDTLASNLRAALESEGPQV